MKIKQFHFPTAMLYGPGALAEFSARLAVDPTVAERPVLLVSDPGLVKVGLVAKVTGALESAGLSVAVHTEVHGNPIEADAISGADRHRDAGAHAIVALGGGSPMDVAKAIAVLVNHDGPLSRFDDGKGGDRYVVNPVPPIYAIPTTAGTGSEVGRSGVIICADTKVKTVIFHPDLMPRIAVLDAELSTGLPAPITAATGMDAFTHNLEAYLARGFHPMADAIGLGGMELVIAHLPRAVSHPDDLDARGNMLLAASMGATAFQKGLGVIHSLAHPMSTHYGTHHGLANAVLMPPILRWQLADKADRFTDHLRARYQRVARLLGRDTAEQLPDAIAALNAQVGITQSVPELGLRGDDIPSLADEAFGDVCHRSNPIALTRDDMAAAFASCL